MIIPLVVGISALTAIGTGRAAFRAFRRLQLIPPEMFIEAVRQNSTPFSKGSTTPVKFLEGGFQEKMTYNEALQILSLPPGSSAAQISKNHRRLMLANHPDHGGSNYFASKINEAKDLLLKLR